MWHMHARTFDNWHRKKNENKNNQKKVILHIWTDGPMQGCGLTFLVVCIDDKLCYTRESKATVRSEDYEHPFPKVLRS